jgi:hypothetical protein
MSNLTIPAEEATPILSEFNYESLKAYSRKSHSTVKDLLALAVGNDPFYAGSPQSRTDAEWFASIYRRFDFRHGVHLRRIHYTLVSAEDPILTPSGEPYFNTEKCWLFLCRSSKAARYLLLVDSDDFDDRKNPPPVIFRPCPPDQYKEVQIRSMGYYGQLDLPEELSFPVLLAPDFFAEQPYHLEIWCEKSTMNDVLIPVCQEFGANLVTGAGELSTTAVRKLLARCKPDRPVRIFYISDFDPAGQSMPVAVARKIEFFHRTERSQLDIRLFNTVLTASQCREFKLPQTPIKDTERRKEKFEEIHGAGATELDALEAIHPGHLRKILRAAIKPYYDESLESEMAELEDEIQEELNEMSEEVHQQYADEIEQLQGEYAAQRAEFMKLSARLRDLEAQIQTDLEPCLQTDPPDMPPRMVAEEAEWPVYDSSRDYLDQLGAYRMFKQGG